jgi:hypothetical protein
MKRTKSFTVSQWHQTLLHGDNAFSLSPDCHEQVEAEANYGAGLLLFLQDQLVEFSRSSSPTLSLVQSASKRFGNTITSSLWRLVEALGIPALVNRIRVMDSVSQGKRMTATRTAASFLGSTIFSFFQLSTWVLAMK